MTSVPWSGEPLRRSCSEANLQISWPAGFLASDGWIAFMLALAVVRSWEIEELSSRAQRPILKCHARNWPQLQPKIDVQSLDGGIAAEEVGRKGT